MSTPTLPPLATATSGAIGSAIANATIFPLDLITSRLQTQGRAGKGNYGSPLQAARTIFKQEGIAGLYSGLESDTLSTLLSNFLYFYAYQALHTILSNRRRQAAGQSKSSAPKKQLFSPLEELAIGTLAGIISRAFTTPISVVTVRKQTAQKRASPEETQKRRRRSSDAGVVEFGGGGPTSLEIVKDIYDHDGVTAFWSGFPEACLLSINPAITMYLLELFKRILLPKASRDKPSAPQVFGTSALASSIAVTLCYPLIISKTRMQSGRYRYTNILAAMRSIVRRNGWTGLFAGWESQSCLQIGLSMTLKSRVELLIVALWRRAAQNQGRVAT